MARVGKRSRSTTTTSMPARSAFSPRRPPGAGGPPADGVDGVKSLAVAMAVREAARTGRAVRVDYEGF